MIKFLLPLFLLLLLNNPTAARPRHVIKIRYPNLNPTSFTWDPHSDHFITNSLHFKLLTSVSDAGVTSTLFSANSTLSAVSLDPRKHRRRLLAVSSDSVVAVDLKTSKRALYAPLDSPVDKPRIAGDYAGNVYVTDATSDVVYRVSEDGEVRVLARLGGCGVSGVVYSSKGYLLVTCLGLETIFKVDAEDGRARRVILNRRVVGGEGIAVRSDGVVLVVSRRKLYFVKSDDSWSEGVVFDETELEEESGEVCDVTVGAEDRVYVLYGYGERKAREEFAIVEVESGKEKQGENVWVFVLIGLGFAYFLFWRFQMKQLVQNMNKKTA